MTTGRWDSSEATARLILQHYVESVTRDVGDSIAAILLIGSLATGSYVAGPGDIDQLTILHDTASDEMVKRVQQHIKDSMEAFGRAVNLATAVYRCSDLGRPWRSDWDLRPETRHLITVPEELLRIHEHGQVIYGTGFEPSQLPTPTMEEMIAYNQRWRCSNQLVLDRHPELRPPEEGFSARIAAQIILSNAAWHYYYATERTCFNKHEVASRLRHEVPGYRFQAAAELALRVRTSGFEHVAPETVESLNRWCKRIRDWAGAYPVGSVPLTDTDRDR